MCKLCSYVCFWMQAAAAAKAAAAGGSGAAAPSAAPGAAAAQPDQAAAQAAAALPNRQPGGAAPSTMGPPPPRQPRPAPLRLDAEGREIDEFGNLVVRPEITTSTLKVRTSKLLGITLTLHFPVSS